MAWRRPTTSSTARGYGQAHRKLRAHWEPLVAKGTVNCWRCNRRITPGTAWELGHDDNDRSITRGPEHKACNRKAGARKAKQIQVARAKASALTGCPICGGSVPAGRTYCSRRCGYIAHMHLPPKPKVVRPPKPPPPLPTQCECGICGVEYISRGNHKYCSNECKLEANRRLNRDRYRAQQGLLVNPTAPTKRWNGMDDSKLW